MGQFRDYTTVKVKQLLTANREFTGTNSVSRSPRVGDMGTVLESHEGNYTVESVDPEGFTVWLADFEPDELEPG